MNTKFKIIIPFYNVEKYISATLDSILNQKYKNYDIVLINDCSNDGSDKIIKSTYIDKIYKYIINIDRKKALYNIYNNINKYVDDDDVVILLDGDDMLYDNNVLLKLNNAYEKEMVLLTHGSYEHMSNNIQKINYFSEKFDRTNRKHAVSHLRTFKKYLINNINQNDLKENGKFFDMTYDMALLFPLIEMAGTRVKFFKEMMIYYNDLNPLNVFKLDLVNQERIENIIRNKPTYKEIT